MTKALPILIGVHGQKESGKDEVGRILVNYYGYHRIAFADPLKEELAEALKAPWDHTNPDHYPEEVHDLILHFQGQPDLVWKKPMDEKMRRLQQLYGTEFRRTQNPRYWLELFRARMVPGRRYIVTDPRFLNECREIIDLDGELWRLTRPGTRSDGHASERPELLPYHRVLHNDGSLADLHRKVSCLLGLS